MFVLKVYLNIYNKIRKNNSANLFICLHEVASGSNSMMATVARKPNADISQMVVGEVCIKSYKPLAR